MATLENENKFYNSETKKIIDLDAWENVTIDKDFKDSDKYINKN